MLTLFNSTVTAVLLPLCLVQFIPVTSMVLVLSLVKYRANRNVALEIPNVPGKFVKNVVIIFVIIHLGKHFIDITSKNC